MIQIVIFLNMYLMSARTSPFLFSVVIILGIQHFERELQFRSHLFVFAFGPFFMSAISLLHKSSITETGFIPEISLTSRKYALYMRVHLRYQGGGFKSTIAYSRAVILWLGRVAICYSITIGIPAGIHFKKQPASPNDCH